MANNPFAPFDLGQVLGQAEAIKSARSNRAMDELQSRYLGERIQTEQQGREQATQAAARQADVEIFANGLSAIHGSDQPSRIAPRIVGSPQWQSAAERLGMPAKEFLNTQDLDDNAWRTNTADLLRQIGVEIQGPEAFTLSPGQVRMEGGQQVAAAPFAPEKPPGPTDDMREYAEARRQGFQGSFLDYQTEVRKAGATTIDMTQKWPTAPTGQHYEADPDKPGQYRLVNTPGARDPRTEAQQKAGLLGSRMRELSGDVKDEAPGITTQTMATIAQGGGISGGLANIGLSAEQQKHFNAARGWLAGVLRQDTGATIQPFEIQEYYPTFFPVPGDTKEVIEQKRKLRKVTEDAITSNAGQPAGTPSPAGSTDNDPLGLRGNSSF